MYDSFDNMYQATIGIDFLSKVWQPNPGDASIRQLINTNHRQCTSRTVP